MTTAPTPKTPKAANLANLAAAWTAAVEARDAARETMHDELDRRRESKGASYTEKDMIRDSVAVQGPFEVADDAEWAAHEAFRDALNAIGTDASVIGDTLHVVGPSGRKDRGGEVRAVGKRWLFGTDAYPEA